MSVLTPANMKDCWGREVVVVMQITVAGCALQVTALQREITASGFPSISLDV